MTNEYQRQTALAYIKILCVLFLCPEWRKTINPCRKNCENKLKGDF